MASPINQQDEDPQESQRWEERKIGDFVSGDAVHGDLIQGDKVGRDKIVIGSSDPKRLRRAVILMVSANPVDVTRLRLDEEQRVISRAVAVDDKIDLRVDTGPLTLGDLQRDLLRHLPAIVHFSGRGTHDEGISVLDDSGQPRPIPPLVLRDLFRVQPTPIECVVLSGCLAVRQAQEIAQHVPVVIGSRSIADDAKIQFANGFYGAIARGVPLRIAFEVGRTRLELGGSHVDAFSILSADS